MIDPRSYFDPDANWKAIPEHMHGGVYNYVMHGHPVGSFLEAVLANDFLEAAGRADDVNALSMLGWAKFLYNSVPRDARGSYEAVKAWRAKGGWSNG